MMMVSEPTGTLFDRMTGNAAAYPVQSYRWHGEERWPFSFDLDGLWVIGSSDVNGRIVRAAAYQGDLVVAEWDFEVGDVRPWLNCPLEDS